MHKILIGITGSISAYKALEVIRVFKKKGTDCICCLTKDAQHFVTPLSVTTLSNNEVITDLFTPRKSPIHIDLQDVDLILVAPATYNIINKVSCGIADDALTTIISAKKAPCIFAPSMNKEMWKNPILQENIKKLKSLGYYFIEPEKGALANLEIGKGRLPLPEKIVEFCEKILDSSRASPTCKRNFIGKKFLVTAGRTEEDIDPIRYISNRSSGKMGYALAEAAQTRGAETTLISGVVSEILTFSGNLIRVKTAKEMKNEVLKRVHKFNVLIMSAAVADYTPLSPSLSKVKKRDKEFNLSLKQTDDILKAVRQKEKKLFIIGFSLDTENIVENAKKKLEDRCLDIIIANDISTIGAAKCKLILIDKKGNIEKFPLVSKYEAAERIVDKISLRFKMQSAK